jgi:dodecin
MSMLKVVEVLCESDKSWEDAAQTAVARANDTVQCPLHLDR